MKKYITIFSIIFLMFNYSTFAATNNINDIDSHWAKETIQEMINYNVINGYTDGTFKPDNLVTVAEFLKMIIASGNQRLIRSGDNIWPDFYIETALDSKLINKNQFANYNLPVTRYEVVDIISNYVDLSDVKASNKKFSDVKNNINVYKLVKLKIICGYEDKTFRGENYLNRAEAATIISRVIEYKTKISSKPNSKLLKRGDLSNYGKDYDGKGVFSKTRYEISNNKIIIFDNGKYSVLNGYAIDTSIIKTKNVINNIKDIISENSYVSVTYHPSIYFVNQLKVTYGESEEKISDGVADFIITYYEDKFYELARISMIEEFSNECYMKIEPIKLWSNYYDFANGEYIDDYKISKLNLILKNEFGSYANKIQDFIIQKSKLYLSNTEREFEHYETRKFR